MIRRIATVFAAGALLIGGVAMMAPAAGASRAPSQAGHGHATPPIHGWVAGPRLYTQNSNDSGVGIVSQHFTDSGFETFQARGVDDFTVPGGKQWTVREVDVTGVYFNGFGLADNEIVTFYADAGGSPGTLLRQVTALGRDNGSGSFAIKIHGIQLAAGTYWVSVQAVMLFAAGGEWGWEAGNTLNGTAAMWGNPGNGFGTGCTDYANMVNCIGAVGEGPDFMFALFGKTN